MSRGDDRLRQLGRDGEASAARVEGVVRQANELSEEEFVQVWGRLTARADEIARKRERVVTRKPVVDEKPRRAGRPPKVRPPKTSQRGPAFTEKALEYLKQHPEGVMAAEVGRGIGQRTENAHGTLKLLEAQELAKPYPAGSRILWGLPGITPTPRVDTTTDMVRAILFARPGMSIRELRDEVIAQRAAKGLTALRPGSIETQLWRMANLGQIRESGAGPFGPTYELPHEQTEEAPLN